MTLNDVTRRCRQRGMRLQRYHHHHNLAVFNTNNTMGEICESSKLIQNYMKEMKAKYAKIREDASRSFWSLVVITTADEDQSAAYKLQITSKVNGGQLPKDLKFHVFADPPSVKIGSGGSVLNALKLLNDEYGADFVSKSKILLICAGGQSQRLPTASVMGKLFLPLPFERGTFHQMLDLKLALYLPLIERSVEGTVLVTCSDDVETYYLPDSGWTFSEDGFTALGHISSIEIGKHHGVYVLPDDAKEENSEVVVFSCQQVLQKPSEDQMRRSNALLQGEETVCTDSVFSFDGAVCRAFIDYVKDREHVTCEIDAYGDFLQPLGPRSNRDYIDGNETVVTATDTLKETRKELYEFLNRYPLKVVLPKHSKFYHLGTMLEYIDNLTPSSENHFFDELGFVSVSYSWIDGTSDEDFLSRNPCATLMHSAIGSEVSIGRNSIVEFCRIERGPLVIGDRCIVNNCAIDGSDLPAIPSDTCFHTVAVKVDGLEWYVTVAFGIEDDLKRSTSLADWPIKLKYMNRPLSEFCSKWALETGSDVVFSEGKYNLWNAELFPVADTMEESFRLTLNMVCASTNRPLVRYEESKGPTLRLSTQNIINCKDFDRMLRFQLNLNTIISHNLQT